MKMSNDTYCVVFEGKHTTERYYRDAEGWLKISGRGRRFRMTAEQVLNHLLPALALGGDLGLRVRVEHYEAPSGRPSIVDRRARRHRRARGSVEIGCRGHEVHRPQR